MNDFKQVCDRVLQIPAPPRRSGAEVVAIARSAAKRRARAQVLGAGIVATLMLGFGVTAYTTMAVQQPPPQIAGSSPSPAFRLTPMPTALPPSGEHHSRILSQLIKMLPADVTPTLVTVPTGWLFFPESGLARLIKYRLGNAFGSGQLILLFRIKPDLRISTDFCADSVTSQVEVGVTEPQTMCYVATIAGEPIRIAMAGEGDRQSFTATRFFDGGFITIVLSRGSMPSLPLSPYQVAELVAGPTMLN